MTDRPIIFSAPMVRALLAGRKTQTRRLATSQLRRVEVGDRLYVREAHAIVPASAYRMSEGVEQIGNPDDRDEAAIYAVGWERSIPRWRPSIHMPRWASRLTLIVEQVRVEPLQSISGLDASAEGVERNIDGNWRCYDASGAACLVAKESFCSLWSSLHTKPGERWSDNPDVVALTFRVVRGNIDRIAA